MRCTILIVLAFLAVTALSEKARYDNYRVYRAKPNSLAQVEALRQVELANQFNFWTSAKRINAPVDILVPPHQRPQFHEFLEYSGIKAVVHIPNVQSLVSQEEARLATRSTSAKKMDWDDYHTLEEIYDWLDELAEQHPHVKTIVGGSTYEGRDIKGIEINNGEGLTGVVIESGIHAREWITPAASSWVVNEIINSPEDSVWRQFNYLYFPSVNPDGYVYSWTDDRNWRRTRTPYKYGTLVCYGADANRNWGSHWAEGGSSNTPCSDIYAGPSAFSEVETKSLSEYLKSVSQARNNDIYVAYHSYSQLLMFPWGYTAEHAPLHDIWQRIGDLAAKDLFDVHGTEFEVGNIYNTIYQTSGTSTEWYYDYFNATLSYVYEMRDTGRYGFLLPPEQIRPSGEEHLVSLKRILVEYQKLKN